MSREPTGFTVIEVVIVVALLSAVAAVAIPHLLRSRIDANETAAVATLRDIAAAETQYRQSGATDLDDDGVGEFGFFSELAATQGVRLDARGSRGEPIATSLLPNALSDIDEHGLVTAAGYRFQVLLPQADSHGSSERKDTTQVGTVDADLSERFWCGYAWPVRYDTSGSRCFFVNQTGTLVAKDDPTGSPHSQGSAFVLGAGHPNSITGVIAIGTRGRDRQLWSELK